MKRLALLALLTLPAFAQFSIPGLIDPSSPALPQNYVAIGGGLASGGANLLGSVAACHAVTDLDLLCVRTDASRGTRATVLEGKHIVAARWGFSIAGTIAGGVASGAGDSVGAAFAGGGAAVYDLGRRWPKLAHYSVGFDFRWDKRNVTAFLANPTITTLHDFERQWDKILFVGRTF